PDQSRPAHGRMPVTKCRKSPKPGKSDIAAERVHWGGAVGTSSREQREALEAVKDPFARNTLRVAYHVRKYILLYVCGALGALALSLFPTLSGGGGPSGTGTLASGAGTPSGQAANGAVGAGATGSTTGAGSTTGLSASGGPVAPGASPAGQAAGATGGSGGGTSTGGPVGQV